MTQQIDHAEYDGECIYQLMNGSTLIFSKISQEFLVCLKNDRIHPVRSP